MFASCSLHYLAQESVTLKVNQLERHWDRGSTSPKRKKREEGRKGRREGRKRREKERKQ